MGDGRYYTSLQFFNTFILLLMIMLTTMNLVKMAYKSMGHKMSRCLITIYGVLCVTIVIRLVEEVVVGAWWIGLLNELGLWLMLTIYIGTVGVIGMLIHQVLQPKKTLIHDFGSGDLIKIIGLFLLPSIFYAVVFVVGHPWLHSFQLVFYGVMAYTINGLLALVTPYGISKGLFINTRDLILDYVFITDTKGKIIYENKHSETMSYFNRTNVIDLKDMTTIFNGKVQLQQLRGKDYIKYEAQDKAIYFASSVKPLLRSGTRVGAIITFTDVTGLMMLLEDLDQKNVDRERINKELEEYASIVYRLEKEKEIQQLLGSIAQNQEKSMLLLKDEILKVLDMGVHESFVEKIEAMLLSAKENLSNVRNAVNAFRAYYGGKDD